MTALVVRGAQDVWGGFTAWRIWSMLGQNDVVRRYRRSRLGQLWLTLSMAVMIFGLGVVYSTLFGMDVHEYLPFVGVGLISWGLISGILNDSCTTFIENEGIIKQTDLARFTYILRMVLRNLIIFAHNLIIIPILFVLFGTPINWAMLLFVPGLLLVVGNLAWVAYILAIVSGRFRDIPQIVQSIVQIAFFVSPVVFRPGQLAQHRWVLTLNPLASLLEVIREPLLGAVPSLDAYLIVCGFLIIGWVAALAFAGRYAPRVIYWL